MARLASRGAIGLVIVLATTGLVQAMRMAANELGRATVFDWPRALDAGINDVVFAGVTINLRL